MKHTGGRPQKQPWERRTYALKFNVTPTQAEMLYSAARAAQKTLSVWVRDLTLSVVNKPT